MDRLKNKGYIKWLKIVSFNKFVKKIIIENQLFNDNNNTINEGLFQKITNALNTRLFDPSTEAFPYKAVRRFIKNNGFFKIADKQYVSILFKEEHVNDVATFYNEFGNLSDIINGDVDDVDEQNLKQSYQELLTSIVGYYLIFTIPESMSGSKTLNEDVFGSNIKFKLISGKSGKSKNGLLILIIKQLIMKLLN